VSNYATRLRRHRETLFADEGLDNYPFIVICPIKGLMKINVIMKVSRRAVLASCIAVPFTARSNARRSTDRVTWNVMDHGAVGDGIHHDGAAINQVFAAAARHSCSTVYFPPGRYLFSKLECDGIDLEVRANNAILISDLPLGTSEPAVWLRGDQLSISDISIDYTTPLSIYNLAHMLTRKPNAYGLRLGGRRGAISFYASRVRVYNVAVNNARGGGIQISRASNVVVDKCNVRQVLGNGIGFDGCKRSILAINNVVEFAGDDMMIILTDSEIPNGTVDVAFRRNTVGKGFAKGIASSGVDGMIIEDNIVSYTYGPGIAVMRDTFYNLASSKNVLVRNNTVFDAGMMFGIGLFKAHASSVGDSIYVSSGTSKIQIMGNILERSVRDGIVVASTEDITICYNRIGPHPGYGIVVGDPVHFGSAKVKGLLLSSNTITGTRDGIAVGSTSGGRVVGNVVRLASGRDGAGFRLGHLSGVEVYKNTVYGKRFLNANRDDLSIESDYLSRNTILD
jgi:hypothetical protein